MASSGQTLPGGRVSRHAAALAAPVPGDAPEHLGRYRLRCEIASGGMGSLYFATAVGPDKLPRTVALKRIHRHLLSDPSYLDMFKDEARIASSIQHPNVVSVIDFGIDGDEAFMTMEYVPGETLAQVMHRTFTSLPGGTGLAAWGVLVRTLIDVCEGLHAAHEARDGDGRLLQVVHRDVSPPNVLVGYDGLARVVDFGIATAADKIHRTSTGEVKGKIGYLAPEQFRGGAVDRRVDVWAVGVMLWEISTRRRLVTSKDIHDVARRTLTRPAPLPSSVADVPDGLDEITARALAIAPGDRHPDARSLGRDLERLLQVHLPRPVTAVDIGEHLRACYPSGLAERRRLQHAVESGDDLALGELTRPRLGAVQLRSDERAWDLAVHEGEDTWVDPPPDGAPTEDAPRVSAPKAPPSIVAPRRREPAARGGLTRVQLALFVVAIAIAAAVAFFAGTLVRS